MDAAAAAEAEYEKFVWDNLPRNFAGHFMHGMLGMTGFRLFNAPTFLPAYLGHISGGSPLIVGLGGFCQQVGAVVSPIVGAANIEHRKRVLPVSMLMGTMMRLGMLGISLAGWFLTGNLRLMLIVTLIFLFLMGFFQGAQGVAFQLLLAKVIPIKRRGILQSLRNVIGGLVAAALSFVAGRYIIQKNLFGNGYATTFFLAVILTSAGLTALALLMKEPEPPTVREKTSVLARMKDFPELIMADKSFKFFMLAQLLSSAARMAIPFFIGASAKLVTVDGNLQAGLTLAFLLADTLTNMGWGYMGDRFGFRTTFIGSVMLWIAATAVFIFARQLPSLHLPGYAIDLWFVHLHGAGMSGVVLWIFVSYIGLGSALSGQMMSSQTMVLEFGTREDMAMRLALTQTAQGITAAIGPLIGGVIVHQLGYSTMFSVSIAFLIMGLMILLTLVEEPRNRRKATV
ncbi:MFS transporter [Caulobacter sp. KR2-114]